MLLHLFMVKFLSCTELYDAIQQMSQEAKEILWVCSPYLGSDAHLVFSPEVLKNLTADIRFVFGVNVVAVKKGEVDPYEVQYFMEHFKDSGVKSLDNFNSKIYIFDKSALISSANLTKAAFESNIEAGVLLDGEQVDEVKGFFNTSIWKNAKPIEDLEKYKKTWNIEKKNGPTFYLKKTKKHTNIKEWTDDYVSTWYFSVPNQMARKTERKIQKETTWSKKLHIVADIGLNSFKQLKLGDLAFLANLNKKRGKIEIELARIFDKSRVETDEGDLHFAYEIEKTYLLKRDKFYKMLQEASIGSKTWEIVLSKNQVELMTNTLSPNKRKKQQNLRSYSK